MRNTLLERLWSGEKMTEANAFGLSAAIVVAILLAATVVALAVATKPAEAAFPGPSGAIAFTSSQGGDLNIYRMAQDGFGAAKLTESTASDILPAWSAEGTQIAFVSDRSDSQTTTDNEIYRMNAAGNGERQLTTNSEFDFEPSWFPSDTKIAFRRGQGGSTDQADIWVLTLDENGFPTATEQKLTTSLADDIQPAVSPNGMKIAFASNRDGDYEIYVMDTNPSTNDVPKKLTNNTNANPNLAMDWSPDWSPSGKQIVFESTRDGDSEIFVMNADGTRQKNLTKNTGADLDPVFSPDGRKIAFERMNDGSGTGDFRDIFRMRTDGTRQSNLTESNHTDANPSWQPMP